MKTCNLKITKIDSYWNDNLKWCRVYSSKYAASYCFCEQDLEFVVNLISFIYSTDGQKLKEIITSPDYETQKFGFQILKSFGFEKDVSYEELVYYMFLWS